MNRKIVVIHYGEIALKGKNRTYFENRLRDNIRMALTQTGQHSIQRLHGRLVLTLQDGADAGIISQRLRTVFGIAHFSFGVVVEPELDIMKQVAWDLLEPQSFDSFRIAARRSKKDYPHISTEINARVGSFVSERCQKRVDLKNADATCFIEVTEKGALMYTEKISGLRGLPIGVSEKAVSLLSSGIDSPVASFKMLKRGVNLIYVHFHSQPFTNAASQENAEKLVQLLTGYQLRTKLYLIPFIDIQKHIMTHAPERLRVLLYRRYMVRLAEIVARKEKATALVTGENVGQVASQTLSNIRVVAEVTDLPILRPLAGYDKEEIIDIAKDIGSFEISTAPYEDCCSLFVPQKPETRARPEIVHKAEACLSMDQLMRAAIDRTELRVFEAYN